jgi:hypothetical protein
MKPKTDRYFVWSLQSIQDYSNIDAQDWAKTYLAEHKTPETFGKARMIFAIALDFAGIVCLRGVLVTKTNKPIGEYHIEDVRVFLEKYSPFYSCHTFPSFEEKHFDVSTLVAKLAL